jgi:hypothetical protein
MDAGNDLEAANSSNKTMEILPELKLRELSKSYATLLPRAPTTLNESELA